MSRFILPGLIFALLVAVFWRGLGKDPSYVPSPLIGKPAPEFRLPELGHADRFVTQADLGRQISLLNVWATWCGGCRQEHAALLEIAQQGDVPIYGLNWKDNSDAALAWLKQLGNPYVATAVDPEGRIAIDWGVYGAPETFLIDAGGNVLYKHIAPITMEIWEAEFVPRIAAARAAN